MIKYLLIALLFTGCVSAPKPKLSLTEVRRHKIYKCTLRLIDREVPAGEAERACTNIFSKGRVR